MALNNLVFNPGSGRAGTTSLNKYEDVVQMLPDQPLPYPVTFPKLEGFIAASLGVY